MSNNLSSYGAWAFCNGHLLLTQQLLLLLLHYSQNHCSSSYGMRQESFWTKKITKQNKLNYTCKMKQKYIQRTLFYFLKYSTISLCKIFCTNHTYQPTPACHICQSRIPLQYYMRTKLHMITWLNLVSLLGQRCHVRLVKNLIQQQI